MKKILIITYYWPPAGGPGVQRVLKFVKYLREFGYEPIILTVNNGDYPAIDKSLKKEIPDKINVFKSNIIEPHSFYKTLKGMEKDTPISTTVLSDKSTDLFDHISKWFRFNLFLPDSRILWLFSIKKILKQIFNNHAVEAIVSSGPPHTCHLIANKASKMFSIPFVTDFRDPWTNFVSYQAQKRFCISSFFDSYLEKKINKNSNACVVISESMKTDLKIENPLKMHTIMNGYDENDFDDISYRFNEFLFTYTGSLDKNRIPKSLLLAAKNIANEVPIKFRFIGKICTELKELIAQLDLNNNTEFIDYCNHNQVIKFLQTSYALILTIDDVPNNKGFLTGKIFEYIGASRPIFANGPIDGDAAKILNESKSGRMIDYNDIKAAEQYIEELYQKFLKKEKFTNSKDLYTRRNSTKKLAQILDEIC
jgi:glycosyltransferase involved in cell wall biosynthesis